MKYLNERRSWVNRINQKFQSLNKLKKKGFIAYITAGDPNLSAAEKIVYSLERSGVDIVELGIPFSDPMADGVVIQRASERSLKSGTTVKKVLNLVNRIRENSNMPIVLFTYLNPIFKYGLQKFSADANKAGIDGVLILDMPIEESEEARKLFKNNGISMIFLVAPTSTDKRIKKICKNSSGFIYYVSREGVTGTRKSVLSSVRPMVQKIKHNTKNPVAVGFGISRPAHVREVAKFADAVVVGSAIVEKIEQNLKSKNLCKNVENFVKRLTKTL